MNNDFQDQVVLVTGAGSGIGLSLCQAFATAGAQVVLNDIDGALAQASAGRINGAIGDTRVHPYALDVADVEAVREMVQATDARFQRIDLCVANAGLTNYGSFLDYTPEAFDRLLAVNLRGSYFSAQAAARAMIARRRPGRVLLLSSITGIQAFLNLSAYGVTKAGISMMARALALELGPHQITVNAICPGATLTERTLADDPHFESNWASVTPTGRAGYVEDIVAAALFLASPSARHITGQTLVVDGGWTLQSPLPAEHPDLPAESSKLR
jgi:glucose 1-dehydrogenase